jgi:hypothetical protein
VSDSLGNITEETSVKLWNFHHQQQNERGGLLQAKMAAIKKARGKMKE